MLLLNARCFLHSLQSKFSAFKLSPLGREYFVVWFFIVIPEEEEKFKFELPKLEYSVYRVYWNDSKHSLLLSLSLSPSLLHCVQADNARDTLTHIYWHWFTHLLRLKYDTHAFCKCRPIRSSVLVLVPLLFSLYPCLWVWLNKANILLCIQMYDINLCILNLCICYVYI